VGAANRSSPLGSECATALRPAVCSFPDLRYRATVCALGRADRPGDRRGDRRTPLSRGDRHDLRAEEAGILIDFYDDDGIASREEADAIIEEAIEYASRLIEAGPVEQRASGSAAPGAATDTTGTAL
jgi:hypothetical protein